ncbi:sigma-70 family RNA polymerase sigma factor [Streptomyces sp. NPDC013157]|uniref:sigma-70 family RNA polymerase sigma factor n=1 Tax=Streptomyces sp. NPDC013157 TaxID=3364861 RepID=UPI0036AFE0A9
MSWTFKGSDGSSGSAAQTELADHRRQVLALHSYVRNLLKGDHIRAEDIVQETLLRCWRTYGCVGNATLRPWMFRVARNLVIDSYRSSKVRPQEVEGDVFAENEAVDLDATEIVLTEIVVRSGLATLSAAHRQVLVEVYFRGSTLEEAALSLGIPKGTVKSRVHYGLQALGKALAARAYTE